MFSERYAMNKALLMPGSHASAIISSEMSHVAHKFMQQSMRVASAQLQPIIQRNCQCNVNVLSSGSFDDISSTTDRAAGTLSLALPHDRSDISLLILEACHKFPRLFALSTLAMNSLHHSIKQCEWKDGKASVHAADGVQIDLHRRAVCFDNEGTSSFHSVFHYGEHLHEKELRQHLRDISRAASGMGMQPYIVDMQFNRKEPICVRIICTSKAFSCKNMQLSVVGMPSNSDDYQSCKKIHMFKTKHATIKHGSVREADMLEQCAPLFYKHTTALQHLVQQAPTHTCVRSGMHEATLLDSPSVLQASRVGTFGEGLELLNVSNTWLKHIECKTPISVMTCNFRMLDAEGSTHSVRVAVASLQA